MLQLRWFLGVAALASCTLVHAEGPPDPRALACATEMLARMATPSPPPRAPVPPRHFVLRPARETAKPFTGSRPLRVRANGAWVWVPVNAPFAMDTYTSLSELQAWLDDGYGPSHIVGRLALPLPLANELGEVRYARDLARRLARLTYVRGRRLVCFDEDGQPI